MAQASTHKRASKTSTADKGSASSRKGEQPPPDRMTSGEEVATQSVDDAASVAPPQPGPDQVLGQIATLLLASPAHRHLFMVDWEWLILPAVAHRQFRIFRRKGRPFAYVSWAFLNEDAAKRMSAGEIKLRPDEWTSGEELWLIDVIAPFGGQETILKEVRENVLPGQPIKSLQPSPDGNGHAVVEW